jgi:hypothetical protein
MPQPPRHDRSRIQPELARPKGGEMPLLLEALFIAENTAAGPQHFEHAFEIEERFI